MKVSIIASVWLLIATASLIVGSEADFWGSVIIAHIWMAVDQIEKKINDK